MKVNLKLRNILEMCALIAVSFWGFQTGSGFLMKCVVGLGSPLLMATAWGIFGSPEAPLRMKGFRRIVFELIFFGLAVLALYDAGQPTVAIILAILVVLSSILMTLGERQR